ncbi:pickpocket protein 28 [Scaptodrosophila lebanonensis]|uniref:Pickpocket protein 28 n=1 Tax=Drosophila lebanonensis TaxID=7225 RepID=A0A6J2THA0_DROLE|nr:pickpocket protein 28 [Scaptodrosophila lebanonensis]
MLTRTKSYEIDMDVDSETRALELPSSRPCRNRMRALRKGFLQAYHTYSEHTSIHGIRYIAEHRPLKERIFWAIALIASVYYCFILINSAYTKWNETPVIVSFAEKSTPVWNIPFPAITICSETKRILKMDGPTFADLYSQMKEDSKEGRVFKPDNISDMEIEEFRTLLHVCNTQIIDPNMPLLPGEDISYYDVLDRMLPPFERYFFYCRWLSRFNECDKFFKKTLTEEGICYTFNGLHSTDIYREDTYQFQRDAKNKVDDLDGKNTSALYPPWSLETGYAPNSDVETYPARVLSAGARSGIFMALQTFKKEVDYACRGPVQGFKVLLHAPDDVPQVSKQFVRIPMAKEVLIAVKPNMITTSEGIAEYHPLRRQCFLSHERTLRFFKVYTQSNCQLECLANFTLAKCGCVKFSMPRTLDMPVCGEDKIYCYDRAERKLLVREFHRLRDLNAADGVQRGEEMACNCMPACTSLVYNTEISQANFDLEEMLIADGDTEFLREYPGSQMSRLSIYFKESQFITSKRSELYGVTDFLANCGGIFGLFIGFSLLSLVEVLYHFTLRFCWNVKNFMKMEK